MAPAMYPVILAAFLRIAVYGKVNQSGQLIGLQ